MKNSEKTIQVFANISGSDVLVGRLFSSVLRGSQVYSFEYSDNWLMDYAHLSLDPDLFSGRGRQFVPSEKKIFGFLSDCAPDGADSSTGVSYLDLMELIKRISIQPEKDLLELWKRILFNVLISNTDDHLRNHGFLLESKGWKLSPLFDVNPNPEPADLKLNITEDDNSKDIALVLRTAKFYGLKPAQAESIAKEMKSTIEENWRKLAAFYGISQSEIEYMKPAFALSLKTSFPQ